MKILLKPLFLSGSPFVQLMYVGLATRKTADFICGGDANE